MSYVEILTAALRLSCWTEGMPEVCFVSILSIAMACAIGGCILLGAMAWLLPAGKYWHSRVLVLTLVHTAAQMPGMYLISQHPDDQQLGVRVALGLLIGMFLFYTLGAYFIGYVGRKPRSKKPRSQPPATVERLPWRVLVIRYLRALNR